MAGIVQDWRIELVKAYADLFHPMGDPPRAQGWPWVKDGWRDLVERACDRIRAAVQADRGTFKVIQIKEKFGSLRIYWDGTLSPQTAAQVEEAVDLAEARSCCTCEICGEPGRLYGGGWWTTRCTQHAEDRLAIEGRQDDGIHVLKRIVGGRRRTLRRRYDRETDSFIDVDPDSLGIEEE
jgi:hypothetical protein